MCNVPAHAARALGSGFGLFPLQKVRKRPAISEISEVAGEGLRGLRSPGALSRCLVSSRRIEVRLGFRGAAGANKSLRQQQVRLSRCRVGRYGPLQMQNCTGDIALLQQSPPEVAVSFSRLRKSPQDFFQRPGSGRRDTLTQWLGHGRI
jgi:hypothetical protein